MAWSSGPPSESEITPSELKEKLDRGEDVILLDVREPQEWDISRLQGATRIPLGRLPYSIGELSTADEIVGGINAWAKTVDPSVPRY